MFSYVWNTGKVRDIPQFKSGYEVTHVLPLMWIEHCVECSAPLCYSTCKIYKPRSDNRCLRFEHGVVPIRFGREIWGGQITFRRWAKLQSPMPKTKEGISLKKNNRLLKTTKVIGCGFERLMRGITWNRHRPAKVVESLCLLYLTKSSFTNDVKPIDGFLATIFNHEQIPLTLIFEIVGGDKVTYKNSFVLQSGWNENFIPYYEIKMDSDSEQVARLYLDNDGVGTLTFMYLDFVKIVSDSGRDMLKPAKKVKCVAWDLDNTVWKGVIGDTAGGNVKPNADIIDLMGKLDQMGVLQTIVSKNTYDVAWKKIEQLGISDYFLYPAINWGRKSQNLVAIAKELNINIDTFALIDDSIFEREEVSHALPQVRVYDVSEVNGLLKRPEFDIPITEESSKRRLSYQTESKRKSIQASYGEDYDQFLRDCQMELTVFRPQNDAEKKRCLELLQRSNQYNVSKVRRTEEEYNDLYDNSNYQIYAMQVSDKYGNYGIVGFVSVLKSDKEYELTDFVMSCRVAQKKVERAFFNWLVGTFADDESLSIDVCKTDRNSPLREELRKMPFDVVKDIDATISFRYKCTQQPFADDNIIKVVEKE